jgi:hypothetical protein
MISDLENIEGKLLLYTVGKKHTNSIEKDFRKASAPRVNLNCQEAKIGKYCYQQRQQTKKKYPIIARG